MVEAGVGGGQPRLICAIARDHKIQVAEALDRDAIRASAEKEEALLQLNRKLVDDLPKQDDRWVPGCGTGGKRRGSLSDRAV